MVFPSKIGDAKFYIHRQHIILVYIHYISAKKSDTILSIFFCVVKLSDH